MTAHHHANSTSKSATWVWISDYSVYSMAISYCNSLSKLYVSPQKPLRNVGQGLKNRRCNQKCCEMHWMCRSIERYQCTLCRCVKVTCSSAWPCRMIWYQQLNYMQVVRCQELQVEVTLVQSLNCQHFGSSHMSGFYKYKYLLASLTTVKSCMTVHRSHLLMANVWPHVVTVYCFKCSYVHIILNDYWSSCISIALSTQA